MDDPKAKEFFEPIEDEIYSLIQQNKDTYDDPSELDKIEKECEANRNNKTIYQYRYCSVHAFYLIKGKLIIYARLLTPEIVEKIKLIPNVTEVTINIEQFLSIPEEPEEKDSTIRKSSFFSFKTFYIILFFLFYIYIY
ncbi:hypothetical protein H8356DRAFT_1374892 [Neocallimastix lanati (nom. inval.)]|nr:hypothetical protein H8356DRAFT_1374892 [Neocallimastix sp. JGI-2020a]